MRINYELHGKVSKAMGIKGKAKDKINNVAEAISDLSAFEKREVYLFIIDNLIDQLSKFKEIESIDKLEKGETISDKIQEICSDMDGLSLPEIKNKSSEAVSEWIESIKNSKNTKYFIEIIKYASKKCIDTYRTYPRDMIKGIGAVRKRADQDIYAEEEEELRENALLLIERNGSNIESCLRRVRDSVIKINYSCEVFLGSVKVERTKTHDARDFYCKEYDIKKYKGSLKNYLKKKVSSFNLSVRSRNVLKRAAVKTVEELVEMSYADLLAIKNCGKGTVEDIYMNIFYPIGLKLKGD